MGHRADWGVPMRFEHAIVVPLLLVAGAAQAGSTYWQHEPSVPGDWFVTDNWTDGIPDITDDTYVESGTVTVATGAAEAYHLYVADTGDAEVLQSGGAVTLYRRLYLGMSSGVTGSYTMTAGALAIQENQMYVGYLGTGIVRQTGGSVSVHEYVYLGHAAYAYGSYEISGDSTLVAPYLYIGSNGSGEFRQAGGTVSLPKNPWGFGGGLQLARYYDSQALYELSAGLLECDYIAVGAAYTGVGEFHHSGGDAIVAGTVSLGQNDENSGTYELTGSGRLEAGRLLVGSEGSGVFTQCGGEVLVAGDLCVGLEASSEGTLATSGGSLEAAHLYVSLYDGGGNGYGRGVLRVEGSGATVMVDAYDQGEDGTLISVIDGSGLSPVQVAGVASLGGAWTVISEDAPPGRFDVLVALGGLDGGFDSITLPSQDWSWGVETLGQQGIQTIWVNHIPEPATLALVALGGMGLLASRRRRQAT